MTDLFDFRSLHDWPGNPGEAITRQYRLSSRVVLSRTSNKPNLVAAASTAYNIKSDRLYGAAVVLTFPELKLVEQSRAEMEAKFPYIPGLRAFREGPVILKALSGLKHRPDMVIYPGHGTAHPRSFGMASHLGLLTGLPSIGCARKCLCGEYRMPGPTKGCISPLRISDIEVGYVCRTRDNVKPLFVSPGHSCGSKEAVDIIMRCLTGYRLPEPLRQASILANKLKNSETSKPFAAKREDLRNRTI